MWAHKACNLADSDFKDLARRTASDKVLRDKAFNITKNPKYDRYQRGLASMVYKCFHKKSASNGVNNEHPLDLAMQKLFEEIHEPITNYPKISKKNSLFWIQRQYLWC